MSWTLKRLEAAVEGFATQLQCPICLCAYDNPVSLPCNHCFCEECIHRALELKQMCPICKLPAKKRRLRYDQMIRQLLVATELLCAPAEEVEAAEAGADAGDQAAASVADGEAPGTSNGAPPGEDVVVETEPEPSQAVALQSLESTEPIPTQLSSLEADDAAPVANGDAEMDNEEPPNGADADEEEQESQQLERSFIGDVAPETQIQDEPMLPSVPVDQPKETEQTLNGKNATANGVSNVEATTTSMDATNPPETEELPLNGPFLVGDLVEVTERTWSGINKPGGTARITAVNEDGTYNVKFVINSGRENGVHDYFIHRPAEDLMADTTPSRSVRKRQRRSVLESPPSTGSMSSQQPGSSAKKRASKLTSPTRTSSPKKAKKKTGIIILSSGFDEHEMELIERQIDVIGASIERQWSTSVTHLVVKCVDDNGKDSVSPPIPVRPSSGNSTPGKRKLFSDDHEEDKKGDSETSGRWAKTRSLKYLKALVGGRWIVSEHWLQECVKAGKHVNEEPFEASGHFKGKRSPDAVRRARLAREKALSSLPPIFDRSSVGTQLFSAFCFHITGEFLPPMPLGSDVDALVRIGGGKVIPFLDDVPREMNKPENRSRELVVVCDKINPIAMREEIRRLQSLNQLKSAPPAAIVNYSWVINSISEAKLLPFP